MIEYVCFAIIGLLLIICTISLYYNFRFAKIILRMEDEISDCLDVLDDKYRALSKVLEIPIFFDSPQVRQVVEDIKKARGSLLYVANKLSNFDKEESANAESEKNN